MECQVCGEESMCDKIGGIHICSDCRKGELSLDEDNQSGEFDTSNKLDDKQKISIMIQNS